MHTFMKSGLFLAVAGLLAFSLSTGVANAVKKQTPKDEALTQCKADCMTNKRDAAAYENCLIKCKKDHKKNMSPPVMKK